MSQPRLRRRRFTASAATTVVAVATCGLLLPLTGSAQAAVTDVTTVTASDDTNQSVNTNAVFTVTTGPAISGAVGTGDIKGVVSFGPEADFAANGAQADISCVNPAAPIPSNTVTCTVPNTTARGAGADTVRFFADKNSNNVFDAGEPSDVVTATFVGPVSAVTLTGPSSTATDTCAVYTVGATDSGGRAVANQAIVVKAIQSTGTATALQFCTPADPDLDPAANTARKSVTTTASGGTVTFGIRTDNANPIALQAFIDGNADNILQPASEANQTLNVTVNAGGAAGAANVSVTPSTATPVAGDTVTVNVVVKNAANNPVAGVSPTYNITGANPKANTVIAQATDAEGKTSFTYAANNTGTDTINVFVNQGGSLDREPSEPQGSTQVVVGGTPVASNIDLTCTGSAAGGTTASTSNASTAENCVVPTSQATETFTATVTAAAAPNGPVAGVSVRFLIGTNVDGNGVDSANDATPASEVSVTTNASGVATFTLTNPNPVAGDAYKVTATIAGSNPIKSDDAFVRWEASTAGTNATPAATNLALGSDFVASTGTVTLTPEVITTQVGSTTGFTATVRDQFGALKSGVSTIYSVSGRNSIAASAASTKTTDANGQSTFSYKDNGNIATATPADTITVFVDSNGDSLSFNEPADTSTRNYTLTAPTAAAIEGGIGAGVEQFGASSPFTAKTDDDTTTSSIDTTHTTATATPVNLFFEVRNADNSSKLPGSTITVTSTGVGALVGANNAALTGAQTVTVGADGYVHLKALSNAPGTQTIVGTADGQSKTLTITWTNTGKGRVLTISPTTKSAAVNTVNAFTVHIVDVYGTPVGGSAVNLALTGPAQFGNGTSAISGTTDASGNYVANVTATGTGTVNITATAANAEDFNAAVNTPNTGNPAGDKDATAVLTVGAAPTPSAATTTLALNPTSAPVGSFITATGTVKDAGGAALAGQGVRFIVTGATTQQSSLLTTDANGQAAYPFSASSAGGVTVRLSVVNSGGVEQFQKQAIGAFTSSAPAQAARPILSQTSSRGVVVLSLRTNTRYEGLTVYFFRRSGITGKVVPAGTGVIRSNGVATRVLHQTTGQILAIYSKIIGATNIATPYSNDVQFKVN